MSRTACSVILFCLGITAAFGQGLASAPSASVSAVSLSGVTAPPHPKWLTDTILFNFFFRHVNTTEGHANELSAKGKDDSAERHLFKNLAHLTGQEEALLKNIAADESFAMQAFASNANSVVRGLKVQYPAKSSLPPSAVQQLQSLDAQKAQLVQTHMASLQSGMTPARFQQFYNFVWGTEGPRIHQMQPGAKPPSGVKPPAKP